MNRVPAFALITSGCLVASIALASHDRLSPLGLALGLVQVAIGGYLYGTRRTIELFASATDWLPVEVALDTTADGGIVATVTQAGGGLVSIPIPEDVADDRGETMAYVLRELAGGDE